MNKFIFYVFSFFCLSFAINTSLFAQNSSNTFAPKEGLQYQTIYNKIDDESFANNKKPRIIEFFSYGCPACNRFEPYLEKWLDSNPKRKLDFSRIPATFEPGWDLLAKIYYVAKNLQVTNTITPKIFKAIFENHIDLSNEAKVAAFFEANGISKDNFESIYNFSPVIDSEIASGNNLMAQYAIMSIPTLVIDGKYVISMNMVNNNPESMLKVADYLLKKNDKKNTKKTINHK